MFEPWLSRVGGFKLDWVRPATAGEWEAAINQTRSGMAMLAIGTIVVLAGLLADPLGVGGSEGFGWKQIVAVAVGAGIAIAGVATTLRARTNKPG